MTASHRFHLPTVFSRSDLVPFNTFAITQGVSETMTKNSASMQQQGFTWDTFDERNPVGGTRVPASRFRETPNGATRSGRNARSISPIAHGKPLTADADREDIV